MTDEHRIDRVLQLVMELASGNLDTRVEPVGLDDPLDGVTEGLNMLAEELSASSVALRRSEESFRTLIERSPDAIVVHQNDIIVYVNQATLTLLGFHAQDEILGKPTEPLLNFDFDKNASKHVRTDLNGTTFFTQEGRMRNRDGKSLDIEMTSLSVNFYGKSATLIIIREISSRKQLTAKMMELDRMIAVGTLAAGVGHEINNPLAYVIANLDYALDRLKKTDGIDFTKQRETKEGSEVFVALSEARKGAERVQQIVSDLKNFSSTQDHGKEPLKLQSVVESAINMAFNEIRHRATLVRDFRKVPEIIGNSSRLSQVFLNLLVNAVHAIPEGTASKHSITVHTKATANHAIVEVTDTGIGVDAGHIPRLFDPFFTTKPIGQGTGLGLYICRRIVQEHGGELQVSSSPGKGSTFRVLLPLSTLTKQISNNRHLKLPPKEISKSGRILVIDDEPNIGRSLTRLLGREHKVTSITDARLALTRLKEGTEYDLVLCDLMMPEMTGIELYDELLRHAPKIAAKIVFFTGGAFSPSSREFVRQMRDRCLEKPLDIQHVRQIVRERVEASERVTSAE